MTYSNVVRKAFCGERAGIHPSISSFSAIALMVIVAFLFALMAVSSMFAECAFAETNNTVTIETPGQDEDADALDEDIDLSKYILYSPTSIVSETVDGPVANPDFSDLSAMAEEGADENAEQTAEEGVEPLADSDPQPQTPPKAPTVNVTGIGDTVVVLNAVTVNTEGKAGYGKVEYGYAGDDGFVPTEGAGAWQSSTTFTGLTPSTKYTFYARFIGGTFNGVNYRAEQSLGLDVTTKAVAYYVTVDASSANPTGQGYYAPNDVVTIYAKRDGYVFKSWVTSAEGVTINNADKDTASFTMPAHNVTVTATWSGTVTNATPSSNELSTQLQGTGIDLARDVFGDSGANMDRILNGEGVNIWIDAQKDEALADNDRKLIAAAAEGFTVSNYVKMTLNYQFTSGDTASYALPKSASPLTIKISTAGLPTLQSGYTRSYKIIRFYDGKAVTLDGLTLDSANKMISFKSDQFGATYALAYTDKVSNNDNNNNNSNNNNGNNNNGNNNNGSQDLDNPDYNVPGGASSGSGSDGSDGSSPAETGDSTPASDAGAMILLLTALFLLAAARIRSARKESC